MLDLVSRRLPMAVTAALLLACYAVVVASAVAGDPVVFAVAILSSTVIDVVIERYLRSLVTVLRFAQFGISHRVFVQIFMLLLLVAATNEERGTSHLELALVTGVAFALPLARVGYLGLLTLVRRRTQHPVAFRNLTLAVDFDDDQVPQILDRNAGIRLLILGVVPVLAGALAVRAAAFWPFLVTSAAYVLLVAVAGFFLLRVLLRPRLDRQELLDAVGAALHEYDCEVVLYFSGSASSTYQVDMWLSTLEQTNRRCCVLLRERHTFSKLAPTEIPVVCIPSSVDLMNLGVADTRVALYVANVGKNIHFLREPRLKHVFIGHGDSDKVGSFNPFSKVYDEIWVAGPAGRERYARAKVGVRDAAIVEVGRPQLDIVRTVEEPIRPVASPLTVLYAPTWEGWTDDDFQTSLTQMGPVLVERLLCSPVPLRLVYRPHPLTGTRDPQARAANARICTMITEARGHAQQIRDAAVRERLEAVANRLAEERLSSADVRELTEEWNETFWSATRGQHLIVGGRLPSMFDCFNNTDILISDVSSVVSDFVASGKPYVVANPKGEPVDQFRETFPSVGGAYILDPECETLPELLTSIVEKDPMAKKRALVRGYLLGPERPAAIERWNTAIDALISRAETEWAGEHGSGSLIDQEWILHASPAQRRP